MFYLIFFLFPDSVCFVKRSFVFFSVIVTKATCGIEWENKIHKNGGYMYIKSEGRRNGKN